MKIIRLIDSTCTLFILFILLERDHDGINCLMVKNLVFYVTPDVINQQPFVALKK